MLPHRRCLLLLALAATACMPSVRASAPSASAGAQTVAVAGRLFAFHSGLWVNLHHFLYNSARARLRRDAGRASVAAALGDTAGLRARPDSEQRAWEGAVAYYAARWAERDLLFDSTMVEINNRLAALESAAALHRAELDTGLASVLDRVAPVYRAVWWGRHDAANRAWIASTLPLLERYGDTLAAGLTRALGASWPTSPLRVDVSAYANWAGAYTSTDSSHVTVSSTDNGYGGTLGLEMLFHEASHTLGDSLVAVIESLAAGSGKPPLYDAIHPIIFFTAGELTRRAVLGHTPYAVRGGMWERGRIAPFYQLLQRHWVPRLDGRSSLRDALAAIVAER